MKEHTSVVRSAKCGFLVGLACVLSCATSNWLVAQTVDEVQQSADYATSLSRSFREASAKVLPTVVAIKTAKRGQRIDSYGGQGNPFEGTPFEGTPLEDLLEDQFRGRMIPRQEGLGSGCIIDPSGIILTNNHVVAGFDDVVVEMADGREFDAVEVKTDPYSDLAVVRIKADEKLPAATLGESDQLQIGDWVLAVGSPFGLQATVSAGIISAKGRALEAAERAQFLQTDAAINPGNSGGPLVNLQGEVIGINTAIASRTGAYQGIGFAIPSDLARWVIKQLVESGRVTRSYLGVGVNQLTAELAESLGGQAGQGVVVMQVYPNSPAAKVGLVEGDIILTFEGREISTPRDLQEAVERSRVGAQARLEWLRDGKKSNGRVTLEELPAEDKPSGRLGSSGPFRAETRQEEMIGLRIQALTPNVARQLGYAEDAPGVVVAAVDPNSLAAEKGIRPGMLILRVGNSNVDTVDQYRQAVANESLERGILMLVATPDGRRFVVLKGNGR
jgi:serine protease Do